MIFQPILLSGKSAAILLGMSKDEFYRNVHKITANHGLKPVMVGRLKKYSYRQLTEIVDRCIEQDVPLYEKE